MHEFHIWYYYIPVANILILDKSIADTFKREQSSLTYYAVRRSAVMGLYLLPTYLP